MKALGHHGVVAAYVAAFLVAPYLSQWVVGPEWLAVSLGMPVAVVGYGLRDVLHEAFGQERADRATTVAFLVRAIVWSVLFMLGFAQDSFRLLIAGEIQLIVSQLWVDSAVYERLRGLSFARRYNLSNLVGITMSLVIFVIVGFWGVRPVAGLIAGGLMMRIALSAALTFPMQRIVRLVAATLLLITAAPATALDIGPLKFNGSLRAWASDSPEYPWRGESTLVLRYKSAWVHDWMTFDPAEVNRLHHKLTLGVDLRWGFAAVGQMDALTGRRTISRAGLEWRW